MSTLKNATPPDNLHDDLGALDDVIGVLQGSSSIDKWNSFFSKTSAPSTLKIVQYVMSVPVSNVTVERNFSVMVNVWTDERNRLGVDSVKSELCVLLEYEN